MNDVKTEENQFRFLIKEIDSNVKVLRLKVSANVIKSRKIHLLEWAIIAPLVKLDESRLSIEEIAKEFRIEKLEFLYHTARQLTTLEIIQEVSKGVFKITELGKILYNKGEMQSDSREIDFPMFYEKETAEWFVGSNLSEESLLGKVSIYDKLNFSNFKDYVPEEIINRHAKVTNRIGNNEYVLENKISDIEEVVVPLKANVFLKASGLEVWTTEQPFGDYHRKLLSETLKRSLLHTGRIKTYFEDLFSSIEGYDSLQKVQSHTIPPSSRLFLPVVPSRTVDEMLKSNPSWLIIRDARCFEYLNKYRNKPLITVYIKQMNNPFTVEYLENDIIIPKSIEMVISNADIDTNIISEGTLISEKTISSLNIIEAEGCEIPLYIVQKNNYPDKGKELLISILEKSDSKFKEKLSKFYIERDVPSFYDMLKNYPIETITDLKSSKKALNSITELISKIGSIPQGSRQELEIYDKIMEHLFFDDLVELDGNAIFQCKNAYFRRLHQLIEKDFAEAKNDSWESILSILEKKAGRYKALFFLNDRLAHSEAEIDLTEVHIEVAKILETYEKLILEYIKILPSSSNQVDIAKLLKIARLYNNSKIESICLKRSESFISPKITYTPSPRESSNITEDEFYSDVVNSFESTGFNLLDANLHTKIKKIYKKRNETFPSFDLDSIIANYLPKSIEKIDSKNKVNNLITNLSELNRVTKAIDGEYVIKILKEQENALIANASFEDIKIWLCLLLNTKKKIEKDVGKKILDSSNDKIWNIIHPYIEKDASIVTTVEKDLNELDLGEQVKDSKKKDKKKTSDNNQKSGKEETEIIDTPFEEARYEEILKIPQFKLLSCPSCERISVGFIDIESSKPVLSCGYCDKKIEIESGKFVFDSNVLVNGLFSDLSSSDFFTGKTIIIPETVSDEVNHWKKDNSKKHLHKLASEEIKRIREAYDRKKLTYKTGGKEASFSELIEKDRADKIIARDAKKENAIVITSDRDFINIDPDVSVLIYKNSPPKDNEIVNLKITDSSKSGGIAHYKGYNVSINGFRDMKGAKVRVKIHNVSYDDHSALANVVDNPKSKEQDFINPTRRV